MNKVTTIILSIIGVMGAVIAGAFVGALILPLIGAFSGWVVSIVLPQVAALIISLFGLPTATSLWQVGAALGFIGSFFKSTVTKA